jgi:hypothetical protein
LKLLRPTRSRLQVLLHPQHARLTHPHNQSVAFLLELTVVIILVIELFYFFRGKPV